MHVLITGKQVDVDSALRAHVADRLSAGVAKYFDRALEAHVVFSRQGPMFRADCSVHVGSGIKVQGHAQADQIHVSFDLAVERIEKQLRRHKRRLRSHHKAPPQEVTSGPALAATAEEGADAD